MTKFISRRGLGRSARRAVVPLAMIIAGCGPEGAGTVDVGSPNEVRAKKEEGADTSKPRSEKQAKARAIEAEAAKKNPKLQ